MLGEEAGQTETRAVLAEELAAAAAAAAIKFSLLLYFEANLQLRIFCWNDDVNFT